MGTDAIVTHLMAGIAVIMLLGFVFGAAARRLGQPEVVGQIFAGIALGPSLLGRLPGHLTDVLFPPRMIPYFTVVSQVVLVLFLFAVGYELDLRVLRRQRRAVPLVSLAAFALPMLLGGGSAAAFGSLFRPTADGLAHRSAFVLFMAVALSVTAVPVLAGILGERGASGTRAGVVAMASAGVIDALGWLALATALLLGGPTTAGHLPLPATLSLFGGYVLVMVGVVRPLLLRWLRRPGALVRSDIPVIVAVAVGSAWATSALGLHVIFGAFMAGLIIPRTADGAPDADLVRPLQETGVLLLPLFFAMAGIPVDLGGMRPHDLALLGLVCGIAVVGKIGGGGIGARAAGMSGRDSAAVGFMLNTRGLTELIALNIGLQAGLISRGLYTVLVVMALLTTVLTGPLLSVMRFPHPTDVAGIPAAQKAAIPSAAVQ